MSLSFAPAHSSASHGVPRLPGLVSEVLRLGPVRSLTRGAGQHDLRCAGGDRDSIRVGADVARRPGVDELCCGDQVSESSLVDGWV
jgi:hypothetical protein